MATDNPPSSMDDHFENEESAYDLLVDPNGFAVPLEIEEVPAGPVRPISPFLQQTGTQEFVAPVDMGKVGPGTFFFVSVTVWEGVLWVFAKKIFSYCNQEEH